MALQDVGVELGAENLRPEEIVVEGGPAWSNWLSRPIFKRSVAVTGDLVASLLSYWAARAILPWLRVQALVPQHRYDLVYAVFLIVFLYLFNLYGSNDLRRPEEELEAICKADTLTFLCLTLANLTIASLVVPYSFLVSWYLVSLLLLLAMRFSVRGFYLALWQRGLAQRNVVLAGSAEDLTAFQKFLSLQRFKGYHIAGRLVLDDMEEEGPASLGPAIVTKICQSEGTSASRFLDLIVICSPSLTVAEQVALDMLSRCGEKRVEVQVYSSLLGAMAYQCRQDEFCRAFCFRARSASSRRVHLLIKSLLERLIGLGGSLVVLMLTPVVGALIKLEDGGPIFYRSAYLDRNGQVRYYLKFRSMCVDADEKLMQSHELQIEFEKKCKLEKDPRVTRVGRFLRKYSVDEFPQFFSVLSGDLSFVGPRTIREEEGFRYGSLLPKLLTFKPGLTGFWQVMGRQTTTYEDRINMDMFYIDHWSIWLDLIIMAKTVWITLTAKGAY